MSARRRRSPPPKRRSPRWPRNLIILQSDRLSPRSGDSITAHDPARFHHSGVGAVSADADRGVDGGKLGFAACRRSAGARRGHDLSADAARLPAAARCVSRCAERRRRDPAAHRRASATSTRTRSRSPKPRPATSPPMRSRCRRRSAASNGGCCWRSWSPNGRRSPELHGASGTPLVAQTPAAACALADDLARLIDDMTTRGVPWDRLDDLVPDEFDAYWQLTLKFLADRARGVAGDLAGARSHRAGDAARRADQGGGGAACAQDRWAGDCRRLDRLDPGDGRTDRDHRAPAARRGGAAGPRYRSRRSIVAADCRRREEEHRAGARPSAIRHAGAARAHRHRAATRSCLWRSRAGASGWSRKRCGRPRRPNCGAQSAADPDSTRMPMPRSTR